MGNIWQLQDAKSKFSEMVDRALAQGVQIVTRRGKKTVAVIPYDEYQRLTHSDEDFVDFFLNSPLAGLELKPERFKDLPPDIEIEP